MQYIPQSTAYRALIFLTDADGAAVTSATSPTATISKNGGSFAASTNSVTEVGSGLYYLDLSTTETNTTGGLALIVSSASVPVPWRMLYEVGEVPAVLGTTAANTVADHVLRRNLTNVEASADGDTLAFDSIYGSTLKEVARVATSGSTITIYKNDLTTALDTLTVVSTDGTTGLATEITR